VWLGDSTVALDISEHIVYNMCVTRLRG